MTSPRTIFTLAAAWFLAILSTTLCAQATRPTASLVTFGPGEELYERFGHNAVRLQDPSLPPPYNDIAFHYGNFVFGDNVLTDFLPGFVQGTLRYWVAAEAAPGTLVAYRQADRTTILQELNLTPEQNQQLVDFLWNNAEPANREYVYAPYNDNCSTRLRDAIDRVTVGQLKAQSQDIVPGHSYRFHTRRAVATNPPVFIGLEFILGQNADKPITRWDEMFLPGPMHIHLRNITLAQPDGQHIPLIRTEEVLYQAARPDLPDNPPRTLPWFAAAGLLMSLSLFALGQRQHRRGPRVALNLFILAWALLATLAGCIGTYLMFLTSHWATYRNENLLQMPPFALVMLLLLPWALRRRADRPRHPRALRITQYVAIAMAGSGVLGLGLKLLPWFRQENWNIIIWVLPVNIAIAIILWRRTPGGEPPQARSKGRGAKQ